MGPVISLIAVIPPVSQQRDLFVKIRPVDRGLLPVCSSRSASGRKRSGITRKEMTAGSGSERSVVVWTEVSLSRSLPGTLERLLSCHR